MVLAAQLLLAVLLVLLGQMQIQGLQELPEQILTQICLLICHQV